MIEAVKKISSSSTPRCLPRIRQDLELFPGPILDHIGQTWRIRDPARNRFFDIGPFEFAALSAWSENLTPEQLASSLSDELDTEVQEHKIYCLEFMGDSPRLSLSPFDTKIDMVAWDVNHLIL